jgi:integrase/recombinase XerD
MIHGTYAGGSSHAPQNGMTPELVAAAQLILAGIGNTLPFPALTTLPFQFPSLQHLDERLRETLRRAEEVDGLSSKTTAAYRASYRQFRRYLRETNRNHLFLGGQAQSQVRVLEDWIAWLRARGVSYTTVNTYWRSLHAPFARIAREDGLLVPTSLVQTPKPGRTLPRFLTRNALSDVFRFVRNYQWGGGLFERARNTALLATMALAGCRLGETLRLQVEDVDIESPTPTIHIKHGKGRNGGKPRVICMPPALVAAMATYLDIRRDRGLATDRVFVSVQGDQPIAVVTVRRLCRVITEKTGIKVAPHLLRHTCATLMRQEGVTDRLSMEQLGHSSLAVLQKYSHVAPGERSAAIARISVDLGDGE